MRFQILQAIIRPMKDRIISNVINCSVFAQEHSILEGVHLTIHAGQTWLITGPNGSGKSALGSALAGRLELEPGPEGLYQAPASCALVSFEEAARLIAEDRANDDSEFIEGGIDIGRTPRRLLRSAFSTAQPAEALETHPAVLDCGIVPILDRGLKYLSTGEIRRTMLAQALIAEPELLILDEPYEGLDARFRIFLDTLIRTWARSTGKALIVIMDRPDSIAAVFTNRLELAPQTRTNTTDDSNTHFFGQYSARDTQKLLAVPLTYAGQNTGSPLNPQRTPKGGTLVEMRTVSVAWSGRTVLDSLNWTLRAGEHWLIRGPNGSGKTTFLELITGDNPQAYRNAITVFGARRGSGESIWDIKARMGIVSHRLHQEYRMVGDLDLCSVLVSGMHDSIGLYERVPQSEIDRACLWLRLAGFSAKNSTAFSSLSYGEQRAVLILRAAIKCPEILILDEPCHGLDGEHRAAILHLLEKIAETGTTTLLHVTHDPTEVLPCERSILELDPASSPMWRVLTQEPQAVTIKQ